MLTERQRIACGRRALRNRRAVWAYVTAHPRASLREISYALGLSPSPSSQANGNVAATLRFLRRAGVIDYLDGDKRAHEILIPFIVKER